VSISTTPSRLAEASQPQEDRLRKHVSLLASPEFSGRRGEGAWKAADYLVDEFTKLGLKPLFGEDFFQPFPANPEKTLQGRNVGAMLRGTDPAKADEWIIVSAHYDHLGMRGGVLYPGADDNASGVAMMLEVARSLVEGKERPRRSVMFIGFDFEEAALYGSRYFAEHCPVPLDRIKLFVTADMIGRSLGGVCKPWVFVMGSEHIPEVRPWILESGEGRGLNVGILGADLLLIDRSDYGPFRSRKVPFLFFSTGENPSYHKPSDVAETLDYPKLESISRLILGVVRKSAKVDVVPAWKSKPENPMSEAETVREVFRILLEHRDELKIGPVNSYIIGNSLRSLDGIVKRGRITPEERGGMVRAAQIVLSTLF
jgi:hypothetical protein